MIDGDGQLKQGDELRLVPFGIDRHAQWLPERLGSSRGQAVATCPHSTFNI